MTPDWPGADALSIEPLPTRVAGLLLDHLLTGQVPPGTRLPSERQLAETFGVGRSVVREALKSLGLLGLVEVRQGNGTYLRRVESEFLPRVIEWGLLLGERRTADLVEARQHLEAVTAGLAAQRRTEADLAAMTACLQGMRDAAADIDEFVTQDVSFHLAVAAAAGNAVLSDVLRGIQALLRVWITRVVRAAGDGAPSYREHLPVYEAIAAGDPELATATMRAHLSSAAQRLGEALDSDRPASLTAFTRAADPRE